MMVFFLKNKKIAPYSHSIHLFFSHALPTEWNEQNEKITQGVYRTDTTTTIVTQDCAYDTPSPSQERKYYNQKTWKAIKKASEEKSSQSSSPYGLPSPHIRSDFRNGNTTKKSRVYGCATYFSTLFFAIRFIFRNLAPKCKILIF